MIWVANWRGLDESGGRKITILGCFLERTIGALMGGW